MVHPMSGETRNAESGWTVDTLRMHLERIIAEHDARYEQRFDGITEAQRVAKEAVGTALLTQEQLVQRAEAVNDRRFETFTSARRASDDALRLMMPRIEADQRFNAMEEKAQVRYTANDDKFIAVAARLDRTEGRSGGFSAGWGYLLGAATLVSIVIGAVVVLAR
jgi:adenine deaminase